MTEPQLLNCTRLSELLDKSPSFVTAMKRAGYRFRYEAAARTTLAHALDWLETHPEFVAWDYLKPGWERLPKCSGGPLSLAVSASGTPD